LITIVFIMLVSICSIFGEITIKGVAERLEDLVFKFYVQKFQAEIYHHLSELG